MIIILPYTPCCADVGFRIRTAAPFPLLVIDAKTGRFDPLKTKASLSASVAERETSVCWSYLAVLLARSVITGLVLKTFALSSLVKAEFTASPLARIL